MSISCPTERKKSVLPLDGHSQKVAEFLLRQSGLFQNLLQQPALHVATMDRHRGTISAYGMLQGQMTAALFQLNKTRAFKCAYEFGGVYLR